MDQISLKFLTAITLSFMLLFVVSCNGDNGIETEELTEDPELLVPHSITEDGQPEFYQNRLWLNDYSNYLHAIQLMATVSRDSEYGNEAYRPELYTDGMSRLAEKWLETVQITDFNFNHEGRFTPWIEEQNGSYVTAEEVDLSVYPHLVYAYHIHHRSGRFDYDDTLYNRLNREATNFLVSPGIYLLDEHFQDGRFVHTDGSYDHKSMSYALGGLHAHAYSWIVWKKPGGADDMGVLDEAALEFWMGYGTDDMMEVYREVAVILDEAWDEERSVYNFGDGTTWKLDAIGAMIRGKKAMYDFLYMFGNEDDADTSRIIFDRTVAMFEAVTPLIEPWGLPERIEFTANGASAASENVNLYDWYQFLNHLGGGYGLDREREGMPMYITELRDDLFDEIGEISDAALLGLMEFHLNENGRLVTEVSYSDGSISDDRMTVSTAGMFIAMAANLYRKGSDFERASDWDSVSEEIAERSRKLYDLKFDHFELLENF
jgi:hypothetical protein